MFVASTSAFPESHNNMSDPNYFVTAPNREKHEKFFRDVFEVILKGALFEGIQRDQPVLRFKLPEDMKKELNLSVSNEPIASHDELLKFMEQVIKYSVKTGHPYFVNQLYSGLDPYGVCADWAATALNGSVYTYEVAPVFTIMELEIFENMRSIVGFPPGKGDGLFCPGGSMANGYAISLARYRKRPEIKSKGLFGLKPLIMFSSEDAHYSFKKLASFQGLGADQVVGVKVDSRGKMDVQELKKEIELAIAVGNEPFLVAATAGTTVLGAFDPLEEIADVCAKFENIWFHVDAAWGGGTLMSDTYRGRLKGIERADSVTWNPHKLLCAPQQCSTFLLKDEKIASEAHATHATYLFQKDKFYDASLYDTGDKHIQCGRRADVFKFLFMWKAKGKQGFAAHIDHLYETVQYAVKEIKQRSPEYKLILEDPECTNICFWYIPPSLQHLDTNSEEFREKIHKVAPKIKERMMKEGSMMVTYQPLRTWPNFFRLVLQSSEVKNEDINYFLDEIKRCGQDL